MSRKQKRMGPVGCFGQIENIKRQSLCSRCCSPYPIRPVLFQYAQEPCPADRHNRTAGSSCHGPGWCGAWDTRTATLRERSWTSGFLFLRPAHPLSWAMISRLYKIAPVTEINLQKLSKLIGKIHKIIAECIVITWVIFAQMIIIR